MGFDQRSLFDTAPARARGPRSSQLTLDSLGRDESLKRNIARAVMACSVHDSPQTYDRPVTDDDITDWLEIRFRRRFQRNVVARTRGLLQQAGWFLPVPDVVGRTGRPTRAVIPSEMLLDMSDD